MSAAQQTSMAQLPWLVPQAADFTRQCRSAVKLDQGRAAALLALSRMQVDAVASGALSRAIGRVAADEFTAAGIATFNLAVLSSSTFDIAADCIPAAALRHHVAVGVSLAPFGQIVQEALNPASATHQGDADAVLVAFDDVALGLDTPRYGPDADQAVAAATDQLRDVVDAFARAEKTRTVILQTLAQRPEGLFGNLDSRVAATRRAMVSRFNAGLWQIATEHSLPVVDVEALAAEVGTESWFNARLWDAYKLPFDSAFAPLYADRLGRLIGAMRGKSKKCLVLDLDNTVWGGVIGDDGMTGIILGQGNPLGEAFLRVQKYALDLKSRGIMLAVSSKNTDAVAREPFLKHPDMLLKESDITVFQANWQDKASNLEAIAGALNIGIDALVLLDDNPAERAAVRAALPTVGVPELPDDPSRYVQYLGAAGYFESLSFSEDDRLRVDAMQADALRVAVQSKSRSLEDYLQSLDMKISFRPFDVPGHDRITQLANKTNQFNLTTRRYTPAQISALIDSATAVTLQVRLIDRFSELGMIGMIIAHPDAGDAKTLDIETWLMSCRVLGRKVEAAMLSELVRRAAERGFARVRGTYIPSPKNSMVADHYEKLGFSHAGEGESGSTVWELDIATFEDPDLPMERI